MPEDNPSFNNTKLKSQENVEKDRPRDPQRQQEQFNSEEAVALINFYGSKKIALIKATDLPRYSVKHYPVGY